MPYFEYILLSSHIIQAEQIGLWIHVPVLILQPRYGAFLTILFVSKWKQT